MNPDNEPLEVPRSSAEAGGPLIWELLYPLSSDTTSKDSTSQPSASSRILATNPSSDRTTPMPFDLEKTFHRVFSDLTDTSSATHTEPEQPNTNHLSAPPEPSHFLSSPLPAQSTSTSTPAGSPIRVSQQPSPPHSTPPLSPRDNMTPGPSDPSRQRRPTILSQSLIIPSFRPNPFSSRSPSTPDHNTTPISDSSLFTTIPPPLFSFLQSLNEPLIHLADVFIELGFVTDHRLDVLCRKPESWKKVEARIETKGTFADWLIVEEGLEARALVLASR